MDATSWYEIRTRTVDDCQNVNTTWVNDTAKTQEMSWGDYHQLINISNTAQNLSYYPVRIDLNSSNVETNWNWTEDENATRFTYYNYTTETETEIPFWIESWNLTAETSTIWVNVTSLANNTNTTIYLYYGNTYASSASNGTNTFEFFDDFPGSSLDGAKWPYHPGTPVVSESTVLLDGGDKICSPIDFGIPCSMRARSKASADDSVFLETYYANTSETYGLQLGTSDQGTHGPTIIRTQVDDNGRDYRFTDTGVAWKNYAIYEITRVSIDIARCYQNDYLLCNETEKVFDAKGYVGFHVWGASSTVTVDWVFVRKYASPEPVVSIGTQPRSCPYGDICVNEIGWWYNNSVLNTSSTQIQNAIDNATDGDSIYVYNGNYTENVDVTKQLTLTGEGTDGVKVTNSTADSHVFNVSANYVNISRFNVTGATGNMKAGIYIGKSVDQCNISSNTVSDNYIGIYLDSSSSGNRLADNIISDNTWDNYLASSTSAFSNNTLSGTTVSLTYSGDVLLKGVGSPASDPTGQNNIGKFINVTNQSVGAWMFLNFSYSDTDLSGLDESSLAVWKYNGTAWIEDGWNGSRYLDTTNNVVGVNATSFSVFAPMGSSSSCPSCTVSVTPGDLKANSTGTFTAIINCTAPSGINTSRFIMTQTVEGGIYPEGPPNRWSIRPPMNDIAQSNGSFPQILRAYNRGKGDWYDFAGLFTDNYSYAVHDITRSHVTITNGSKWAELNYTGVVEPTVFRNNFFLDRKQLEIETKKEYNVYANHPLLIKFWDLEHIRGAADYTACAFRNIHYSGTPTADLKAYYCNNSYKTVSEELPNYGASDATANMTGNVLLMHLDEMSEIIVDYSGAGNNGTNNGAEYGAPGKINTSLSFNGSDSVNVSSSSSLNMGGSDFTIEVWAKTDSTWSAERLLVKHGIGETGTYQLTTENSENFKVNFYGMSSSDGCLCNVDWTDGQWHHLVGVFDNSANYLCTYYDGKLCAATPETNAPDSVDGLLHIGSGGTEKFFDGELDEVAVYNRSLSADEIKANYKRGIRKPSRDTDNCVCLNTLGAADLNDIYYTSRNSSYSRSCYGINGNKIAGINATGTYYIAYESDTTAGNCYSVRYANGSSGTNVSFADSNVAWSSTDDADNWIQAQFTPDLWFSAITDGDRFQLGVYAESNVGSNHTNFTLYTDDIGDINYPISNPSIAYYENAGGTKDYDLTGLYAGDMTININMAKDPDAPGTVKHSLYLYNSNGMLNTTINSSFYSQDDSNVNVIFDTSMVSDAEYRIKVTAVDGDNSSDVESYLTTVNFTIDNTAPTIQLNDPADKADLSSSTVNFNWTTTDNLDGALSCDLTIDGVTNQSGITSISGQPTNYSVPGISNGSHNWYMTCRDDAANAVISETRTFGINDSAPDVTLNSPPNGSVTPNNWVIVNATVTDADDDNMTVCFYADDSINGLNASEGLVYIEDNVADGSAITYKLTALPVKPDEDGLAMLMHFDNRGEYGEHTERGVANAVYDFTGNGNNGTLGSATTSTAPVWDVTGGKFAGTFEFDGSDDYIDCGDDSSLNLDNSSFTVSLWFNTISNATNVRQTLLSKGSTHTSNNTCLHLDLFRDNNESINMRFWGNDLEVNTKITANTWHHAAFAYNTSDMNQTIYLDGACVGFKNIATNLTGTNGDSIRIGRRACGENDNPFNGAIDEVALYTRTLSATEILNQYRLEKGKYYWKVNTTDGVLSNESDVWNFYAGYNPDLRVINVTFDQWNTSENRSAISETGSGCHVKENRNIAINVTIANYADENVTSNFDVSFFDSAGVSGNWSRCFWNSTYNVSTDGELGSITTGDPHNTTYITGYWNPSLVGTHNISVWADPANSASESAANTTNNNASAVINVSAWQKYYGNVSGSIVLSDSASDSLYDWTWSNESDVGYAYIVKNGASINWSALHALGCDSNNALNASGHDFHDADTNLGMVVGSNNSTGFVDNNITELFGGGSPSTASFRAPFTVYGNLISNVPIINSTIMVNHTSVESANFVTGILWDATSDTNGYYDATNETLVFVTKIRVAATGLGGAAHNYEFAAPCTLNPVVGGDMDIYMELK
ncbi:MAG: DUF2341 domain-containing protein [Euryarchaeota archaeon]|nr:DUF2341 domain-containing protein [Euryarchaeota archaeon]